MLNLCIISGFKAQLCLIVEVYEVYRSIPKKSSSNRNSEKSVCFIRVFECNAVELVSINFSRFSLLNICLQKKCDNI